MAANAEYVRIGVADGTAMRAWTARPAGIPKAGLIVLQEAFGVNAHIRDLTERFAREGYLAIAPELFHRTGAGFEGSYDDFAALTPHYRALTDAGTSADIKAAFEWLQSSGAKKVSAIGYCMGGRAACLAALTVPLASAVSYYGGGIAPNQYFPGMLGRLKDLTAPMLFFWGGLDKHIGPEQTRAVTDALRAADKPHISVEISYGDHGFFCDARPTYNAEAAAEAWALTLAFLNNRF